MIPVVSWEAIVKDRLLSGHTLYTPGMGGGDSGSEQPPRWLQQHHENPRVSTSIQLWDHGRAGSVS